MKSSLVVKLILVASFIVCGFGLVSKSQSPKVNWRPTKVPAGAVFAGRQACAECHADKNKSQLLNSMGRALEHVHDSEILSKYPSLTFSTGAYKIEIIRKEKESFYTVTKGADTLSVPIRYAFGQGKAGQTYVLEYQGEFYESLVSFYNEANGLDFTIGLPRTVPESLKAGLGRVMSGDETMQCFACHSTGAVSGKQLHLDKMEPGITCEGCHGPGADHIKASKAGDPSISKIFNPGKMSPDDLTQDFCASCHRGAEDLMAFPRQGGLNNVRFQPYRIFNSKCYSDDQRISCVACHNVHEPLQQDSKYYDAKCAACHTKTEPVVNKICKVGTKNCASCHMPKLELPGAHSKFTDHRIRIVKAGEPYPN